MRTPKLALSLAALSAFACSSSPESVEDLRQSILNGEELSDIDAAISPAVHIRAGGNSSGTLITHNAVLTAAHVVGGNAPSSIVVTSKTRQSEVSTGVDGALSAVVSHEIPDKLSAGQAPARGDTNSRKRQYVNAQ